MIKIIELIKETEKENKILISFEFFCPKTQQGIENLKKRIKHLNKTINISFISITCTPKTKDYNRTINLASSVLFYY